MTMKSILLIAALMTPLATPAFAVDDALARKIMVNAVDGYIRPSYSALEDAAHGLSENTAAFCAAPSDDGLKGLKSRFSDLVEAWARIEIVREGPVLEKNRYERILFYPDRKSTGQKQVQKILADPDASDMDAAGLAAKSVAVQGLGAYELTFFGREAGLVASPDDAEQCRYGLAVSRNIEAIAGELSAAWDAPDGVAKNWKEPGPANPVFRTGDEALQAMIGIFVHGVETVRDQRVKPFYKGAGEKTSPRLALLWRSENTMRAIHGNVSGLADLWKTSDMRSLLTGDAEALADAVEFDFKAAADAVGKMEQPTAEKLADGKYQRKIDFILFNLRDASTRIDRDVGAAVGLSAGFSFGDGD